MNMFKSNGGFTLVELIVVIAILAILAGIAVPAYSGYIAKAEQAADIQVLSTVNTAVQGLALGKSGTVSKIIVSKEGNVTVTATDVTDSSKAVSVSQTEIEDLTGDLNTAFGKTFYGATWVKTAETGLEEGWNLTAKPTT